jgi:hypothetical protein
LGLAWMLRRREKFYCLRRELNLDSSVDAFYFIVSFTTILSSPDLRKGLLKSICGDIYM